MKLKEVSLFTGIGGFSYGLRDILDPIAYCEIDPFCRKVLERNMKKGLIGRAPIIKDIRQLKRGSLTDSPDIITGGFPCQDLSTLGHRAGLHGTQSGLFFELMRVVRLFKPKLILLENVPALVSNGMKEVIHALNSANYDCRWMTISAGDLGASHLRRRWYCLAKNCSCGVIQVPVDKSPLPTWSPEIAPHYRLVKQDFPDQKERCGAIGNAIVPRCARYAFYFLLSGSQPPWKTCSWEAGGMQLRAKSGMKQRGELSHFGFTQGKSMFAYDRPAFAPTKDLKLVVKPPKAPASIGPLVSRSLAVGLHRFRLWATPCKQGNGAPAKTVTDYQVKTLKSMVLHERSLPKVPDGRVGPIFVEWLMGYPQDYTKG